MSSTLELDEHEVVWDRYREGPYSGMTLAKARLVNDALHGHLVRVWSVDDLECRSEFPVNGSERERQIWRELNPQRRGGRAEGELGIYLGMRLPGTWGDGFQSAFDSRFATSFDNPAAPSRCNAGTQRVMGLGVVGDIEVLEPDPWAFCADCCCWRPREYLRERAMPWDWGWIAEEADTDEGLADYYHDLVCREDCQGGT